MAVEFVTLVRDEHDPDLWEISFPYQTVLVRTSELSSAVPESLRQWELVYEERRRDREKYLPLFKNIANEVLKLSTEDLFKELGL